jgi:hypothetical protein
LIYVPSKPSAQQKSPAKLKIKSRKKRAPGAALFGNVVPFTKFGFPRTLIARVFVPGFACDVEGCVGCCDDPLCTLLSQPRQKTLLLLFTRYMRAAAIFGMIRRRPEFETRLFVYENDTSFLHDQSVLEQACTSHSLYTENGLSVEETLAAAEREFGITPGDGAPQS